jgi:hypothetical protein
MINNNNDEHSLLGQSINTNFHKMCRINLFHKSLKANNPELKKIS